MSMNRRRFFTLGAAGMASLAAPAALADSSRTRKGAKPSGTTTAAAATLPVVGAKGRVVVVGGGMGGASVAKYLRAWGGANVEVTLIEKELRYTSNILSNLVLTGALGMTSLYFDYAKLKANYGVKVVQGEVTAVDTVTKRVHYLVAGKSAFVDYDRLVIAPGIDFLYPPGLAGNPAAQNEIVHAWKAGPQTEKLRSQLLAMPTGGRFVMTIPPKPYRCPPGPYERACVVADWVKKNKGPAARVTVLDANPDITAEVHTFTQAFYGTHAGVIDYRRNEAVLSVDPATKTIVTPSGAYKGDVLNVIPPHTAGQLAQTMNVADAATTFGGRFCNVDVLTYESKAAPFVHVIGDASATTQPKAGHIANQEAKVCADAIVRLMSGQQPDPCADDQLVVLFADHRQDGVVAVGGVRLRPGQQDDGDGRRRGERGDHDLGRSLRGHVRLVQDADGRHVRLSLRDCPRPAAAVAPRGRRAPPAQTNASTSTRRARRKQSATICKGAMSTWLRRVLSSSAKCS